MRSQLPNQSNWTTTARPLIRGMFTSGMEDGDAQSSNNPWYIQNHGPAEQYHRTNLNSEDLRARQLEL